MVESAVFIGTVIIAITQAIKYLAPRVNGAITILVAALVGLLVALLDTQIGVADISVAQGILIGLSSAGVVTVATKVNTGTTTPVPEIR
jgi:hypothetical protein